MEQQGIIKRYLCAVDWKHLGPARRVLLLIKIPEHLRQKAQAWLASSHHINNLWRLNDRYCFAAEAMFVSLRQQEVFIAALLKEFEDIEISSCEVIENPKWEGFLTDCLGCRKLAPVAQYEEQDLRKCSNTNV